MLVRVTFMTFGQISHCCLEKIFRAGIRYYAGGVRNLTFPQPYPGVDCHNSFAEMWDYKIKM